MLHQPNPVLNEEERELLNTAPEECFRRVVERGVLSLDGVLEGLSPRLAAVVQSIATGERPATFHEEGGFSEAMRGGSEGIPGQPMGEGLEESKEQFFLEMMRATTRKHLTVFPQLLRLVDERVISLDEALSVAHTIDFSLGRYATGTRYAVP